LAVLTVRGFVSARPTDPSPDPNHNLNPIPNPKRNPNPKYYPNLKLFNE